MLKKSITYESFDGETVTEDFYFHISKAELAEMELSKKGGMEKWLKSIVASEDGAAIISEFKKLLLTSYGEKSEDGKRFRKSETLREDFQSSPAFDVLFMELVTDAQKAAEFVNGIVPQGLAQDLPGKTKLEEVRDRVEAKQEKNVFDTPPPDKPGAETIEPEREDPTALEAKTIAPRVLTRQEAIEMDDDELRHLLATGEAIIGK